MPQKPASMTVRELVIRYLTAKDGEPNKQHLQSIGKMLDFFGHMTLEEISQQRVLIARCHEFGETKNLAPATVTKQLSNLRAALRWGWHQGLLPGLPRMWLPNQLPQRSRALTEHEIALLLKAADESETPTHLRLIIYLTLLTNQYRNAIIGLTWKRVRLADKIMIFEKSDGTRERVPIHPRLLPVLEQALKEKVPHVDRVIQFRGKAVQNPYWGLEKVFERAGLSNVTSFDLRRSKMPESLMQLEGAASTPTLFISHSRDAQVKAKALVAELERLRQPCWYALRDAKAGLFPGQLTRAIQDSYALIVLVTPDANDSADVLQEVLKAARSGKTILPVIVDSTKLGDDLDYYLPARQQLEWSDAKETARAILVSLDRLERER